MKWKIAGADRATGEDRTVEVEAHDERQAQMRAKALNLLVEKIETTTPIPDYKAPIKGEPRDYAPQYPDLSSAATGLAGVGTFFSGLGWAAIVLGFFGAIAGIVFSFAPQNELPPSIGVLMIVTGLSLAAWGAIILFAGELGRTVAQIGRAVRDLAINSYK